ncbi:TPA: toprim domain-containing protein [Streptococcus suis]|uniref:PBECR4 domain-containing protein n=1 Tax=Streptococcus suis TaxID=1307 RepID=UPI00209AA869|nr:PBECR4 domain-containing protein [Streptococcus suis]MCO8200859.1 PBECR4 domain-containing protein [Streptococcus suis]MCO8218396.1 PBECR4 domain-containing protein [Streptococcus suis]HEM3467946.1 toprim domain-containing protein [Streptococcus suis]HEM3478657.1 toprim domain-containing protein [Streptococcus suis]
MTNFTKEEAKAMSILDVAISLGMEMKRDSHQEYYWTEHDSLKINVRKNTFSWYSRDIHGDVIDLVETVKGVSFKEAMHFLKEGEFPKATINQRPREPFRYTLQRFERPFEEARTYLKEQRGLSDATIDFFGQQGVLAQANKKAKDDYLEPVVVFKSLDRNKRVIGANLQGIIPNTDRYEGKGYLKQILFNSDGLAGMSVDVGSPKRLVFAEAPIDLMSYYELNKDKLQDVRLVAMDGLKEQTISRYTMELVAQLKGKEDYKPDLSKVGQALEALAKTTTFFKDGQNQDLITLAVDNDKAGRDFIEKLQGKGIPVQADLSLETKDWNDYLKLSKQGDKTLTQEKALGQNQELYYNAGGSHRNPDSLGDVSPGTASKPVVTESQPDFPVIAQLQFTTNNEYMSSIKDGYHVIKPGELARLNKFAPGIQATAQWYLNEVANSTIHYLYQDADAVGKLSIQFSEENFAHLTGISPKGVEMRQVVHDFAQGKGDYGNIQVSHAIKDKSMVLPLMPDILSPQAFVFDDLSSVEKFQQINLAQAIKTEDEDLLLAVRDVDGDGYTDQEEISLGTAPFDSQDHPGKTEEEPPKPSLSELIEAKDLKGLGQHMKEGIKTYLDSDQYKKFLNAMSKLHDYSPRNIAFLLAQNPDVSMVASFQKWKNDFDRQVQKGERGLKVWTPYTVKLKNPDGSPRLDKDGNEMSVTRFTLGTVFDVSQTQGKEIPKPIYNLEGDVPDFETIYLATKQTAQLNNVSIRFDTIEGSANGYYHPSKNEIVLADKQMSEAQILKTLFHEMTHADLHSKDTNYSRSEKELQAESVVYVVANHYGIDTSEYSFGYLKFWSQDPKGYEDLTNQLSVVSTEAKSLINRIDTQIEKVKSKSIFLDKFQSKLAQSKEKSNQLSQEKEREASQTMPKKPQHPTKDTSPNL